MYSNFLVDGHLLDLTHLNPQTLAIKVDNEIYNANLEFGCHCFTDEKQNGPLYRMEGTHFRYWSAHRYSDSLLLPNVIKKLLTEHTTYVVPFKSKSAREEQYHYLDDGYYAIFFYINSINVEAKTLKIYIVSAYDKRTYNGNLPKGKAYRLGHSRQNSC